MLLRRQLPNFITLGNLLCGCLGTFFALNFELRTAAWFILAGAVLDFFDGLVARLLKVSGELGKQLDSLADVITFGMAPAAICFSLLTMAGMPFQSAEFNAVLRFFPFIMVAFSAYRLAKFNIDTRQTVNFIGLPTPANALLWLSFPLILTSQPGDSFADGLTVVLQQVLAEPYFLLALSLLMSILLVAEFELFSLKMKSPAGAESVYPLLLLILGAVMLFVFSASAVPFILILYLILSFIKNLRRKKHELHSRN